MLSHSVVIVDDEPPFDRDRFSNGITRVRAALAEPDRDDVEERLRRLLAGLPGRPPPTRQILVRDAERGFFVAVDDIQRISAAGNYVEILAAGRVHLVRDTLSRFIAQLDPREFLRVHRSHVVRIAHIAALHPMFHGDYELVLRDGQRLALSRRYKKLLPEEFRARL
jgi:two-component system LytT family response regulator